jgi:hypothetical protein
VQLTVAEIRRLLRSAGSGPEASTLGRGALVVGMASSPSGRSQALPLQAQRRTAGMNYNCSIRACFKTCQSSLTLQALTSQLRAPIG